MAAAAPGHAPAEGREVSWSHLWRAGGATERVRITADAAKGRIVAGGPDGFTLDYTVSWGPAAARMATTSCRRTDGHEVHRRVEHRGGAWWVDGAVRPDLVGCVDVDLWPTPLTNTLALRHVQAAAPGAAWLDVAWVDALTGDVARRRHGYTPLGHGRWRFESPADGFTADIKVDAAGAVVDYPGLFRREGVPR